MNKFAEKIILLIVLVLSMAILSEIGASAVDAWVMSLATAALCYYLVDKRGTK